MLWFNAFSPALCVFASLCLILATPTNGQTIVSVRECADLIEVSNALTSSDVTAEFEPRVLCDEWTTLAVDGGANELTVTMAAQDDDEALAGGIKLVNVRFEVSSSLTVVPDVTFTSTATAATQVIRSSTWCPLSNVCRVAVSIFASLGEFVRKGVVIGVLRYSC